MNFFERLLSAFSNHRIPEAAEKVYDLVNFYSHTLTKEELEDTQHILKRTQDLLKLKRYEVHYYTSQDENHRETTAKHFVEAYTENEAEYKARKELETRYPDADLDILHVELD